MMVGGVTAHAQPQPNSISCPAYSSSRDSLRGMSDDELARLIEAIRAVDAGKDDDGEIINIIEAKKAVRSERH